MGLCLTLVTLAAGCAGPQSALQPAGRGAESIAQLFWWMLAGATVIWLIMIGLAIYSVRAHFGRERHGRVQLLIIGGGTAFPTVILTVLLVFSMPMIPELLAPASADAVRIEVRGKMWWWRVRYLNPPGQDGSPIELANEIRLPVGREVEFELASDDVLHAFWIPSLGGKVDMFPGRMTRLRLEPTKVGVYRGACAEYCGDSHALMNFDVVVMPPEEFDRWLQGQRVDAAPPAGPVESLGQEAFLRAGCQACHAVRGVETRGAVGPDLTHVGGRLSLAAAALPNEPDALVRWIADAPSVKPGARMPPFETLSDDELAAIAAYLKGLR